MTRGMTREDRRSSLLLPVSALRPVSRVSKATNRRFAKGVHGATNFHEAQLLFGRSYDFGSRSPIHIVDGTSIVRCSSTLAGTPTEKKRREEKETRISVRMRESTR